MVHIDLATGDSRTAMVRCIVDGMGGVSIVGHQTVHVVDDQRHIDQRHIADLVKELSRILPPTPETHIEAPRPKGAQWKRELRGRRPC